MAFAPPVARGNFYYHDGLYVDVGNLNRHKRASVEDIRTILRPDLKKSKNASLAPPKDQVGHWYEAQLIHYGLPPSKDKARAKMRLLEALNSSRLAVPPNIVQMEAEMKKEYAAAERKAKAELKGSHVPSGKGGSLAVGMKRKQAESSVDTGIGNEYHGPSGMASSQPQTKKAKKESPDSNSQKAEPLKKTTTPKTEQSLSEGGGAHERPRQTARKGSIQTARSTTLHAAWLADPTLGPGPINPATGVSYKHPSEMSMGTSIKKEPGIKNESSTKKEAPIKKQTAKKEPAMKKDPSTKKEPAVKKEPPVKKEPAVKRKPAVKKEPTVKKVPAINTEPSAKKEPAVKKDPAVKKEPAVKTGPAVKKEPTVKKELAIKKETGVEKEPVVKKEPSIKKEPATKKDPAIKKESGIKKEPVINKEPAIKKESAIKKETPIKKEPKPKKETIVKDEPSSSPSSHKSPSLGLINGIYDISCPTVESEWDSSQWNSNDLTLTLTLDGTTVFGAYDLGVFTGILFLPTRPYRASPQSLPFTWRGRENGEGEMSFGDNCDGEISFLGNGRVEGWISVYGECKFEGRRREEAGTAVRSARSMREEWEGYNEEAYEEERVGRW